MAHVSLAAVTEIARLLRDRTGRIYRRATGPGRVERREAVSNKLLEPLVHQSASSCVAPGTFPAQHPLTHDGQTYAFWFWTINGQPLHPDPTVLAPFLPPSGVDCVSRAVQWYYKTGDTGGDPAVYLWAFNMATGTFSAESPVAAPPEAEGENHVLTQDQAWTITARDSIGGGGLAQSFHHWWRSGSPPQPEHAKELDVAQKSTGAAVAFYGSGEVEVPEYELGDIVAKHIPDVPEILVHVDSAIIHRLAERITRLEHEINQGRAFIRADERPPMGGIERGGRAGR